MGLQRLDKTLSHLEQLSSIVSCHTVLVYPAKDQALLVSI